MQISEINQLPWHLYKCLSPSNLKISEYQNDKRENAHFLFSSQFCSYTRLIYPP